MSGVNVERRPFDCPLVKDKMERSHVEPKLKDLMDNMQFPEHAYSLLFDVEYDALFHEEKRVLVERLNRNTQFS